jgi:hypothetical protein
VAKYYTRTARIFDFAPRLPTEETVSPIVDSLRQARDELAEALDAYGVEASLTWGYPRVRLAAERAAEYQRRLDALIEEFITEEPDPAGKVYALAGTLFVAPPYLQGERSEAPPTNEVQSPRVRSERGSSEEDQRSAVPPSRSEEGEPPPPSADAASAKEDADGRTSAE